MTKPELVTLIMANTDQYKKTHLVEMYKADLEQIAAAYLSEQQAMSQSDVDTLPGTYAQTALAASVEQAYDEHAKMVKGPRMDKDEFRAVAVQKTLEKLSGDEGADAIGAIVVATITELLENKTAFCPISDTEKLMLSTIPLLPDFTGSDAAMDGKGFLAKVKELHGVDPGTSRALMVALMKKQFYSIRGIKSGQKRTTIHLMARGIRYLGLTS